MSKQQNVTDEQIIAALLSNGTQQAAAAAVGLDVRTIYNRMAKGEFKALYRSTKADIIRTAVNGLNAQINAALETVVDVMKNEENNPAVRLQAAQTILNNAGKFADRLQHEESAVAEQQECTAIFGDLISP